MEKTARKSDSAMSKCLKRGIRIYPQPWGRNFKIVIEKNGAATPGEKIFDSKTVFDRIREIYKEIANNLETVNTNKITT